MTDRYLASEFPTGTGTTATLIRSIDWSNTPVGPMASWPRSLATTIETMLCSRHPMFLWWGPQLIQFYNDAYIPSFGDGKHPAAMGQPGRDCWSEIWPLIGPQIEGVMARAEPTWHQDALVPVLRNHRLEEVYWSYGYSPVFDDDRRVGGTLVVCTETTASVVGQRRQRLLRAIAEQPEQGEELDRAFAAFAGASEDIPFAVAFDPQGAVSHVMGLDVGSVAALTPSGRAPAHVEFASPLVAGPWPEPITEGFVVSLGDRGSILFGVSPRLTLDLAYRDFFTQLVSSILFAMHRREVVKIRTAAEVERRNLLQQAPIATAIMTGPDHRFELANPLYVEMVGRDVLGLTYIEAFPELAETPLPGILDDVYRTGTPFVTNEILVPLDRAGTGLAQACYFKFNLQPIRDADGVVYGMMAVALEITEVVRARQEQIDANARLLRAQDERIALIRDLEAANRAKDEFLAMLGHELRNPLAPIVTALELVKLGGERAHAYQVIEAQVGHVIRLVDDLLDVARITRGKVVLKKETVDLRTVITRALELAGQMIEQHHHHLFVELPTAEIRWHGDPVRLAQVLSNLLTNAARYTPPGGNLRVVARADDDEITVAVSDDGVGITPELMPRIFELFVQGDRAVDRSEGGLGIGLTLARNLVTQHGGTLTATSGGTGRGSEFVVRLPRSKAPVDAARPEVPHVQPTTITPRRVLVVDDNIDAADLLAELLRAKGHDDTVAHDPLAALDVFPRFRPEVAILDIGLPVMDGYELAGRLHATDLACRLVAITGYGQDRDRERATAAGFVKHLVKPVDLAAVLRAIDG